MDLFARRTAGLLLHPTSLPGPHGIGDLGEQAHRFVDFLAEARLGAWQMLPVGPAGRSSSPYDATSAFAGSPSLISLASLQEAGLLTHDEVVDTPELFLPNQRRPGRTDLRAASAYRLSRLRRAFDRATVDPKWRERIAEFRAREASWIEDHALFSALKEIYRGLTWTRWDTALRSRTANALDEVQSEHAERIAFHVFLQLLFEAQWRDLRGHASRQGIALIGDVPIYVALESADVWSHPELFDLRKDRRPRTLAGVPPDYFNRNGQLWGNPTYQWDQHAAEGFTWWTSRLERTLTLFDNVRLDHFIGFHHGWTVAAGAKTARRGTWRPGPGPALFDAVRTKLGPVRLIAEDLGSVTPEVEALRDAFGFRGLRVLQFGFDGSNENIHLPHNFRRECVAYTGTHDNKTAREWFDQKKPDRERGSLKQIREHRQFALTYLGSDGKDFHWDLIRAAFASVADTVIIPVQDVLGLGREARLNQPGTARNNWNWRLTKGALRQSHAQKLGEMVTRYGRGAP